MTRFHFDLQVPVQYVGMLVLLGTKHDVNSSDEQTTVYFLCQCPNDAPLVGYFHHWAFGDKEFIADLPEAIESVDGNHQLKIFTRTVKGKLENPEQFLCATANKLLRELRRAEDVELSIQEMDDSLDWANENYGSTQPMPNFKRPRHAD